MLVTEVIETGKTVDLAIEAACAKLGYDRSEVQFEILDLPKTGFLGLKQIPAKVRVYIEQNKQSKAREYLESVLEQMGASNFTITEEISDESISLQLQGSSLGFIIGHRGETLDALQYLTGLTVNRLPGNYTRVMVDSGNFRQKREKTLESLARRLARNAVKSGRSTTLEPMNPYERRIIHAAVSTVEGAVSSSVGEEPNRRVVVASKNPRRDNRPRTFSGGNNRSGGPRPNYNDRGGSRPAGRDNRSSRPNFKREDRPPIEKRPIATGPVTPRNEAPSEAKDIPLFTKIEIDE